MRKILLLIPILLSYFELANADTVTIGNRFNQSISVEKITIQKTDVYLLRFKNQESKEFVRAIPQELYNEIKSQIQSWSKKIKKPNSVLIDIACVEGIEFRIHNVVERRCIMNEKLDTKRSFNTWFSQKMNLALGNQKGSY